MTRTLAELQVSRATYNEIEGKLRAAGYGHLFHRDGLIDMQDIGLKTDEAPVVSDLAGEVDRLTAALVAIASGCPGTATEHHNGTKPCPSCASWSYAAMVLGLDPAKASE